MWFFVVFYLFFESLEINIQLFVMTILTKQIRESLTFQQSYWSCSSITVSVGLDFPSDCLFSSNPPLFWASKNVQRICNLLSFAPTPRFQLVFGHFQKPFSYEYLFFPASIYHMVLPWPYSSTLEFWILASFLFLMDLYL